MLYEVITFLSSLKSVKEIIENLDRLPGNATISTSRQEPDTLLPTADAVPPLAAPAGRDMVPKKTPLPSPHPETVTDVPLAEKVAAPPAPDRADSAAPEDEEAEETPETGRISAAEDISSVWKKVIETIDAPLASKLEHAHRITSYNVCYTKLLRTKPCSTSTKSPT